MKKDKQTTQETDVKKTKATSGGGKDKNDGGLPASELKAGNSNDKGGGRSGGIGA
jgi:hypothetical protein